MRRSKSYADSLVGRRDYVYQTGQPTRWLGFEGANLSLEYAVVTSWALARRFAWGPGQDELLVQYEGAGTSDRRWYYADERGSTVAVADGSGNPTHKLAYDDYGNANVTTTGNPDLVRMRYTGQEWQAQLGLYNYKSRLYAPGIGRFLQTDPIGTAGGINLYAYVGGDPVNGTDPFGLIAPAPIEDHQYTKIIDIGECTGDLTCSGLGSSFVNSSPGPASDSPHHGSEGHSVITFVTRVDGVVSTVNSFTVPNVSSPVGGGSAISAAAGISGGGGSDGCGLEGLICVKSPPHVFPEIPQLAPENGNRPGDYCGSSGNSPLVPQKIGGADIDNACRQHDTCYGTLGASKSQCDKYLRSDILSICEARRANGLCYAAAYVFYFAVNRFGQPAFDAAQRGARR